jgi:hypothetical protein
MIGVNVSFFYPQNPMIKAEEWQAANMRLKVLDYFLVQAPDPVQRLKAVYEVKRVVMHKLTNVKLYNALQHAHVGLVIEGPDSFISASDGAHVLNTLGVGVAQMFMDAKQLHSLTYEKPDKVPIVFGETRSFKVQSRTADAPLTGFFNTSGDITWRVL